MSWLKFVKLEPWASRWSEGRSRAHTDCITHALRLHAYCLHKNMLTCLHAYMLTCLHPYLLTSLRVYMVTRLHAYTLTYFHDYVLPCLLLIGQNVDMIPTYMRASLHVYTHTCMCVHDCTLICSKLLRHDMIWHAFGCYMTPRGMTRTAYTAFYISQWK